MLRLVVFLATLVVAVRSQSTNVNQCTHHEGELPIHTYVEGCETPPCILPQLSYAVVNTVFRAPRTTRTMKTYATAYLTIFGITSPFGINYDLEENSITCNFLQNTYCPLMEQEVVTYTLMMFIETTFPVGTNAFLEFRIEDEDALPVLCLRVSISITSAVENK